MASGFYSPAQLAAIKARQLAHEDLDDLASKALLRAPQPAKVFDLPGIYEPGVTWAQWWGIAGPLVSDTDAAHQLAIASAAISPSYAAKAQTYLLAWARTCTGLGPGNDGPLCFVETVAGFILADVIMPTGWASRQTFLDWVGKVYIPTADSIKTRPNNWGACGTWGALLARRHLGLDWSADVAHLEAQLLAMISPAGLLVQEMLRTGAQLWYSYFALVFLTLACRLVRNAGGPDYFRLAATGPRITAALDNLLDMVAHPTAATGKPVGTAANPWPFDLIAAMGEEFPDATYRAEAAPFAPINYFGHHTGWNMPTLTALAGY